MNHLKLYFEKNQKNQIHKWEHYFDIYDKHFSSFRDKEVFIVEFGVSHGGSLQMWKDYFGKRAKIYGIDINPNCKKLEEDQIEIIIGNQENRNFLKSLKNKIPRIDILIDDGGHTMKQQINTFEELFDHIDKNGIYLCEDIHTSYLEEYGGGYKKNASFIEYSKNFIDYIHAWHSMDKNQLEISNFTKSVDSIHYYNNIIVIEKRPIIKPFYYHTGKTTVKNYNPPKDFFKRVFRKLKTSFNNLIRK